MRKADWRDHWIFRFSDSLLLLGGALGLIAYLHLGWAGLIGANLALALVIIGLRTIMKRRKNDHEAKEDGRWIVPPSGSYSARGR
jgi:hypothetical protein